MSELNKLVLAYLGKDVDSLGLIFDNAEQVRTFLKKRPFSYTLLPDSHEVDKKYHVGSRPTSMVICKKGNLKMTIHSNSTIREELGAAIDSLR